MRNLTIPERITVRKLDTRRTTGSHKDVMNMKQLLVMGGEGGEVYGRGVIHRLVVINIRNLLNYNKRGLRTMMNRECTSGCG